MLVAGHKGCELNPDARRHGSDRRRGSSAAFKPNVDAESYGVKAFREEPAHLYFSDFSACTPVFFRDVRCASERERSERERCASSRVPLAISRFFRLDNNSDTSICDLTAILTPLFTT